MNIQNRTIIVTFSVALTLAIATIGESALGADSDEGKKRGRRSGALLGLTLGALTGDAKLAAAGAVAGGAAGGAAGTMRDYDNDRDDYRSETLAAAIATKDTGGQGEAPDGWHSIDAFVGKWKVSMWALDSDGNRIDGSADSASSLDSTTSVTFHHSNFVANDFEEDITGDTTFSFHSDRGFEMINSFTLSDEGNRYVGHYDNNAGKYQFFYAGSDQDTFSGIQRTDYRVVMQMIGDAVIVIETWVTVGTEDQRIQSYRFTRT